jgi:hypothetical protein
MQEIAASEFHGTRSRKCASAKTRGGLQNGDRFDFQKFRPADGTSAATEIKGLRHVPLGSSEARLHQSHDRAEGDPQPPSTARSFIVCANAKLIKSAGKFGADVKGWLRNGRAQTTISKNMRGGRP